MKAALFRGPGEIALEEMPIPECGDGEILIEVKACAICGTDAKIYNDQKSLPSGKQLMGTKEIENGKIMGHEFAGVVKAFGSGVSGYEIGDEVVIVSPIGDLTCKHCNAGYINMCNDPHNIGYHFAGGFTQYVIIPKEAVAQGNVIHTKGIPFDELTLVEPLSCCINGQRYLNIREGESVVIVGAGAIGLMHVELAKMKGAKVILVNRSEPKLRLAKKLDFEIDFYINSSEEDLIAKVKEYTQGGADVMIAACPSTEVAHQSFELVRKGGRISLFSGLPKTSSTVTLDFAAYQAKLKNWYDFFDFAPGEKVVVVDSTERLNNNDAKNIFYTELENRKRANIVFSESVGEINQGDVDAIVIASPSKELVEQAYNTLGKRGRLYVPILLPENKAQVTLDLNKLHYDEFSLHTNFASVFGAYASSRPQYLEALSLLERGKINAKRFITGRAPLSKLAEAIVTSVEDKNQLKIVIDPWA